MAKPSDPAVVTLQDERLFNVFEAENPVLPGILPVTETAAPLEVAVTADPDPHALMAAARLVASCVVDVPVAAANPPVYGPDPVHVLEPFCPPVTLPQEKIPELLVAPVVREAPDPVVSVVTVTVAPLATALTLGQAVIAAARAVAIPLSVEAVANVAADGVVHELFPRLPPVGDVVVNTPEALAVPIVVRSKFPMMLAVMVTVLEPLLFAVARTWEGNAVLHALIVAARFAARLVALPSVM